MNDNRANLEEEELPKRKTAISVAKIGAIATIVGAIATIIVALIARIPSPQTIDFQFSTDENGRITYTGTWENVTDIDSAVKTLEDVVKALPADTKESPEGIDYLTQYAELVSAKISSKNIDGTDIFINKTSIKALETVSKQANAALENTLMGEGVFSYRYLSDAVTLITGQIGKVNIYVAPDILEATIDKVRIENPAYALTITISDLAEYLHETLLFSVSLEDFAFSAGQFTNLSLKVTMDKELLGNSLVLSMPPVEGDLNAQILTDDNGIPVVSKYNRLTNVIEGSIQHSGTYAVVYENILEDMENVPSKMSMAIKALIAKGIMADVDYSKFGPTRTLTRGQAITWIMRTLGRIDNSVTSSFSDVSSDSYYYHAVASALKCGIITDENPTFEPQMSVTRSQFFTWVGRVLISVLYYKEPVDTTQYLSGQYNDAELIQDYAKPYIAIATRTGLVLRSNDGNFHGDSPMTRGQAAVVIYHLFEQMW